MESVLGVLSQPATGRSSLAAREQSDSISGFASLSVLKDSLALIGLWCAPHWLDCSLVSQTSLVFFVLCQFVLKLRYLWIKAIYRSDDL